MTVIGALVATYVRLSTTLEITAGDAVVKLQADVIDKLMPAFLPLVYTPDHVLAGTPRLESATPDCSDSGSRHRR